MSWNWKDVLEKSHGEVFNLSMWEKLEMYILKKMLQTIVILLNFSERRKLKVFVLYAELLPHL